LRLKACVYLGIAAMQNDVNPLTPYRCDMATATKHRVPDRVKPSFVIFDTRAL